MNRFLVWVVMVSSAMAGISCLYPYAAHAQTSALSKPANNLGLAGYWSFNEGAGTVATDFSGNGNHAVFNNISDPATATSGWVPGKRGMAVALDGSNDFVTTGSDPSALDLTGRITIAAWVKKSSLSGFDNIVNKASSAELQYGIVTNGTKFAFNYGDFFAFETVQPLQVNTWYHLVATYDDVANDIDLFINGVEVAGVAAFDDPENGSIVSNNEPLVFGEFINGEECDCVLDEVRIYNRILTSSEIERLYKGGAVKISASSVELQRGSSLESGLVGHWTFDGADTQSVISDRSGSGNHGYFRGGATSSAKAIGKLGQAMVFDGADDFVNPNSSFSQPSRMTVSLWFRTSSNGGAIFGQANATPPTSPSSFVPTLAVTTAGLLRGELWVGSVGQVVTVSPVTNGEWHHAVLVGDSTIQYLYLDGVLVGSRNGTISQTWWSASQIAAGYDGSSARGICSGWCYFNGSIDDARLYNRALSAEEIKQLYTLGNARIRQ